VLSYLERYTADTLRYGLAANLPETSDTDMTEAELIRRNNDELVATWGNLVNRVLTMTARNFDGAVPQPGAFDQRDERLIARAEEMLADVGGHIEAVRLKAGLAAAMAYAQEVNGYLNETEPWKTAKSDRERTATSLYVALCAIEALKVALYPYLPFSSRRIHGFLGHGDTVEEQGWEPRRAQPGTPLGAIAPLFPKIETAEQASA
jgi:methionyl-tRNA synthetase